MLLIVLSCEDVVVVSSSFYRHIAAGAGCECSGGAHVVTANFTERPRVAEGRPVEAGSMAIRLTSYVTTLVKFLKGQQSARVDPK